MKTVDDIYLEKSNSLRLTRGQLFAHYAIVPFLLIAPIFTTYSLIQIYFTHSYTGVRSAGELAIAGYPWIILAFASFFIQKRRLKFRKIQISVKPENFKKAVMLTSNKLNWEIQNITNNYAVANRKGNFPGGSWGELITIIRKENLVLINSICDPNNKISVASWGWNRKNAETFKINLESIDNEDLSANT
jgi:hypothetical protein